MPESLEQKQNKVKAAVEKYKSLRNNQGSLFIKSDKAYNQKEAVKFFGKSYYDEIIKKHDHFLPEKEFKGDYLLYLIVVYISQVLKEPMSNYFGDKKNILHLEGACLHDDYDSKFDFSNCNIEESHFENAILIHFVFNKTVLDFVSFQGAILRGVTFLEINSEKVNFSHTEITDFLRGDKCFFANSSFENSNFSNSKLELCDFDNVDLGGSNMENTVFEVCHFSNVNCCWVKLSSETFFIACSFDSLVNFNNTSLELIRDEIVRSKLMYSSKRIKWSNYYNGFNEVPSANLSYIERESNDSHIDKHHIHTIDFFWYCSDFGYSTKRIIWSFFAVASFFALIYWIMGVIDFMFLGEQDSCWGCVANLFQAQDKSFEFSPFSPHGIMRTIYFSVVTMTTLGFGDIYADPSSLLGYVLLSVQVMMGYFLLGILITRVAMLFTSNEIQVVPALAEQHQKQDEKIKKFLLKFAILTFFLLIILNAGYAVFRRII